MSVADARVSGIIKTEKDHTGKQAIGVHISDTMDTHVQPIQVCGSTVIWATNQLGDSFRSALDRDV